MEKLFDKLSRFVDTRHLLLTLNVVASGLYAGTMLVLATSLPYYWRSLTPKEFHLWFSQNAEVIVNPSAVLWFIATGIAVMTLFAYPGKSARPRRSLVGGSSALMVIFLLSWIGHTPITERLLQAEVIVDYDITRLLRQWTLIQGIKFSASLAGFLCALRAFSLTKVAITASESAEPETIETPDATATTTSSPLPET